MASILLSFYEILIIVLAKLKGKIMEIQNFIKLIFADDKDSRVVYGALPGEIFLNNENKQAAGELASALFGLRVEKRGPCCPQCGGDTFRFLDNTHVRCMLCSNSGNISLPSGTPTFEITQSPHEFFLSKEDALKHKDWLLGMKSRFIEYKKALKEITHPYLNQGTWIKPIKKKIGKRN